MNNNFSKKYYLERDELWDQFNAESDPIMKKSLMRKIQSLYYRETDRIASLDARGR